MDATDLVTKKYLSFRDDVSRMQVQEKTDLSPEEQQESQKPMGEGQQSLANTLEELRQENERLRSIIAARSLDSGPAQKN